MELEGTNNSSMTMTIDDGDDNGSATINSGDDEGSAAINSVLRLLI
jgi:hypothetical protein